MNPYDLFALETGLQRKLKRLDHGAATSRSHTLRSFCNVSALNRVEPAHIIVDMEISDDI